MSRRVATSLCAAAGKPAAGKPAALPRGRVRLDSCRAVHLRSRVATGTDFADAPEEIAPVVDRVKSFVSEALSDGELSPREVAGLYGYVAFETQRLVAQLDELDELDEPETPTPSYFDYMSERDLALKDRLAKDARRKRLTRAIKILTGLTAAGGLIYSLINTSDSKETFIPDKTWSDTMGEVALQWMQFKMS